MLVDNQKVTIKWNSKNKNFYIQKGYIFTGMGEPFEVDIKDLTKGSKAKVKYLCDYCDNEMDLVYKQININEKHACVSCVSLKRKETYLKKYGVDNPAKVKEVQDKMKQTCIEKYGCENPMQNKEILNKAKSTNIQKYGVEYSFQSENVKEKTKQTNLEKYGTEYFSQTNEYKEKFKQTSIEKYGVEHPFQSEEVKKKIKQSFIEHYGIEHNMKSKEGFEKYKDSIIDKYGVDNIAKADIVKQHIRESLYNNGTAPSSKPQEYIFELLGGENIGKYNYPIGYFSVDMAFLEEMIYIEYDGSGHWIRIKRGKITEKQFKKEEVNRKLYLQKLGWKIIRIISKKDKLYPDEQLLSLIDKAKQYLLNTEHTWVEIDIDNNEYRCSQYKYAISVNNL